MVLIVLIIVSILVFVAMRLLPGDPIRLLVSQSEQQRFTEQMIAELRHQFGLDRPLIVQYFSWVGGIFHGDLGQSILTRLPVAQGNNPASSHNPTFRLNRFCNRYNNRHPCRCYLCY